MIYKITHNKKVQKTKKKVSAGEKHKGNSLDTATMKSLTRLRKTGAKPRLTV